MLRDPALIPLSHQHHNGLALCVMIRRSLTADSSAGNIARQARRAIDRYEIELVNHFEIEEHVLFPACGALPLVQELIAEHRTIERMIARLRETASVELLEQFCTLLTAHIRREESQLFELAQREIPPDVLAELGAEIDRRAIRICLS